MCNLKSGMFAVPQAPFPLYFSLGQPYNPDIAGCPQPRRTDPRSEKQRRKPMPDPELTEKDIQGLIVKAMKAKERDAVSVLKMIKTRISMEKGRRKDAEDLPPEDILKIVKKEMKEVRETLDSVKKAGAEDRMQEEENKLRVLEKLVPPMLSEQEVQSLICEALEEVGRDNFGNVMKTVMTKAGGKADGKLVSRLVKEALT
jgi:uncharacterized protein YqeY